MGSASLQLLLALADFLLKLLPAVKSSRKSQTDQVNSFKQKSNKNSRRYFKIFRKYLFIFFRNILKYFRNVTIKIIISGIETINKPLPGTILKEQSNKNSRRYISKYFENI